MDGTDWLKALRSVVRDLGALPRVTDAQIEAANVALRTNAGRAAPRVAPSRKDEIVRARLQSVGHAELAARFGVHRSTIARILRSAGIGKRGPVLSERSADSVERFYNAGNSVVTTAERFGVSKNTMLAFMEKQGIVRRKSTDWHRTGSGD